MWTPKVGDCVVLHKNAYWYGARPTDLTVDVHEEHTPMQDYPAGTTGWVHLRGKLNQYEDAMWVRFINGELVPLGPTVWREYLKPLEPDHVQEG